VNAYSNPQLPQEEINVSEKRPLTDVLIMIAGLLAVIAVIGLLLMLFAQTLASWLPFSAERSIADRFFDPTAVQSEQEVELQRLADSLIGPQGLPPGVSIRVHFRPLPVANASATIGGHITLYKGLIEAIDSENALAMVIAHEIAHVRHRDPVQSLSRGLALTVVLSAVSAGAGSKLADWLAGSAGTLTVLGFSRAQEERADTDALAAVAARYGHVAGADTFFAAMLKRSVDKSVANSAGKSAGKSADGVPVFLRTHPATDERISRLAALAAERGWAGSGELTPLSPVLQAIRQGSKDEPSR